LDDERHIYKSELIEVCYPLNLISQCVEFPIHDGHEENTEEGSNGYVVF
jgi:hypothetical protein